MIKVVLNATLLEENLTGIGQYQWNVLEQLASKENVNMKVVLNRTFVESSKGKELINIIKANNSKNEYIVSPKYKSLYRGLSLLGFYQHRDYIYHDLSFNSAVGKKSKAKIVTFHDAFFLDQKLWATSKGMAALNAKYILPWSAKNADHILVQTQVVNELLNNGLSLKPNKTTVIPMGNPRGKDIKELNTKLPKDKLIIKNILIDKPFILCVGAGHKRKRTVDVIKASSLIKEEHLIIITGKDALQEPFLKESIGNSNNILVLDYVTNDELEKLYQNARALFFPSEEEGFGFPIIEALAYKLPVYASKLDVFKEVGSCFVKYFEIGDIKQIANYLEEALSDEVIVHDTEELNKWLRQFSWEKYGERLCEVYKMVVKNIGQVR
ncbi:glycosyltransferase family 1 protein [Niallia taxi]|uniref:glycosyltransferase family 4 protein n=1 Tax=Niallia taxi TaxID=2499688 RepID=UPI002E1C4B4F|nr:glycosyltransferase family 1 protein [Niallia taxi]